MVRFQGRSRHTTTIPTKPIPTGFKVWGIAQNGFLICWNWHTPGAKNGPVQVRTPKELGGTKAGKNGNKTQAVVLKLVRQLPGSGYHLFLDNLFVSTRFVQYARDQGFGVTGTCRDNSGVIQELLDLKKSDKVEHIPWGQVYGFPTPNREVCQIGWKDQAFVLFMSSVFDQSGLVSRLRKRPKLTSSRAKTSRKPFGDLYQKLLEIPLVADKYNHHMGAVDEFDHLTAQNPGLRLVRRGGSQALEHWLLRVVLVNCYLLARWLDSEQVNHRSQQDFRRQLYSALLDRGANTKRSIKRRISLVDFEADIVPVTSHKQVKMDRRTWCVL